MVFNRASTPFCNIGQRELNKYHIPHRQTHILRTIKGLGPNATLTAVAKEVDRAPNAISKQTMSMEKGGLIKRVKVSDKSNLMRLELTDKGIYMIKVARKSESIDWIFSFLTEEECQQLESILNKVLNNTKEYISKETRRAEFHVPSTWVNVKE